MTDVHPIRSASGGSDRPEAPNAPAAPTVSKQLLCFEGPSDRLILEPLRRGAMITVERVEDEEIHVGCLWLSPDQLAQLGRWIDGLG